MRSGGFLDKPHVRKLLLAMNHLVESTRAQLDHDATGVDANLFAENYRNFMGRILGCIKIPTGGPLQ